MESAIENENSKQIILDLTPYLIQNIWDEKDDLNYVAALTISSYNPFHKLIAVNDEKYETEEDKNVPLTKVIELRPRVVKDDIQEEVVANESLESRVEDNVESYDNNVVSLSTYRSNHARNYRQENFEYRNSSASYGQRSLENVIGKRRCFVPNYRIGGYQPRYRA